MSRESEELIYFGNLAACCFCLVGSLFIILVFCLCRSLREFNYRLVFFMSISDLITAIAFTLPTYKHDSEFMCYLQAILTNFSALSSVLWTWVIGYVLYRNYIKEVSSEKKEIWFILLCYGVPIVFTFLPFTTHSYGRSEGWCWISIGDQEINYNFDENEKEFHFGNLWRLVCYYIPLWIVIVYNSVVYYKLVKSIKEELRSVTDQIDSSGVLKKLMLYPLILILCQTPVTIYRVLAFFITNKEITLLAIISGILAIMNGFFNAIIYGFTPGVRSAIKLRCCPPQEELSYSTF